MFTNRKIKRLIKKHSKLNKRKMFVLPPSKIETIIIISDSNLSLIESQVKFFFPNAKCTFITVRKNKIDESSGQIYTYHTSDLGYGKFKNERLNKLINKNFNCVIDYNKKESKLDLFIPLIDSNLIAGYEKSPKNYFYDILLSGDNMIENFYKQLNKLTLNENN